MTGGALGWAMSGRARAWAIQFQRFLAAFAGFCLGRVCWGCMAGSAESVLVCMG